MDRPITPQRVHRREDGVGKSPTTTWSTDVVQPALHEVDRDELERNLRAITFAIDCELSREEQTDLRQAVIRTIELELSRICTHRLRRLVMGSIPSPAPVRRAHRAWRTLYPIDGADR